MIVYKNKRNLLENNNKNKLLLSMGKSPANLRLFKFTV